ncbi:MAG: hypothetical protein ACYTGG_14515 [Planctomycetota bacterium]|jgi:hypothetical protein
MMHGSMRMLAASAMALGLAAAAAGQDWTEIGDAAEFPAACGQATAGTGALRTITGDTSTGVDDFVDAYVIEITDPAAFYATTSAAFDPLAAAVWDTRLFLFDLDGAGVLANDDVAGGGAQSFLSNPASFPGDVDPTAPTLAAGTYVLAITGWANNARDADNGNLFGLDSDFDALFGVDPAAGPFDHWFNMHGLVMSGAYVIALEGASFVVEEPCVGDLDCDLVVDVQDLLLLLAAWDDPGGAADLNGNGLVEIQDLLILLAAWGPC